ncbi:MAG: hypothetical protein ACXWWD_05895 [Chitinophagaceae bacterium]
MKWHKPAYFKVIGISFFIFLFFTPPFIRANPIQKQTGTDTIIVKPGFSENGISAEWKNALGSRMNSFRLDSFSHLQRTLAKEEKAWEKLIISKAGTWNEFMDSLSIPFKDVEISETVHVLIGYLGDDDGFTYGNQTVCLDLTALNRAYGEADLPENDNRIDRIFAHEYTHLLHKSWARKNKLKLETFKDSILWECMYEGMGMYRSLNSKWKPVNGELPVISKNALEYLHPIFVNRLTTIQTANRLTATEKEQLNKNLSRGSVNQKWGAFPVAIWLALEANGDEKKLQAWIDKGPSAVIILAKKYLTGIDHKKFAGVFK